MTIEQMRAALAWITACLREIHQAALERGAEIADAAMRGAAQALTADEQTRWDEGQAEVERLTALIERAEFIERAAARPGGTENGDGATGAPNLNLDRGGDPFDLSEVRMGASRNQLCDRALRAVEMVEGLEDEHRSAAERLLRRHETATGAISRHILATGSEAYRSAFGKLLAGAGHEMTTEERRAIESARALSLTDAAGGYAVPFTLDPTIIDTRSGYANPFREVATIKTTVTDQWAGVTSSGMTVSWDGEAAEVSDDSPAMGTAPIPVHKAQGFAVGSIEISQDWAAIEGDLRMMIANGKDDAEAVVFATGSGSSQPTGIVTALAAASPSVLVTPTTSETFAAADIYKVEEALGARYLANARWAANRSIYNKARQFDANGGAALWVQLGGGLPGQLIGYPTLEASAMDGVWDTAATAHNYILILGDWRNYVIVDRIGLSVEYIPHIFGDNGRPTGQRGWYCYWRVGADSVNDNAFRMFDLVTAA